MTCWRSPSSGTSRTASAARAAPATWSASDSAPISSSCPSSRLGVVPLVPSSSVWSACPRVGGKLRPQHGGRWASSGGDGRGGLQAQLGDGFLAHLELLDLARDGHRKRVDELPVARSD